jgi:hypothetical protein
VSDLIDAANARRWDGSTPGAYEVWYLTCDHAASDTSYWIRYTLEAPLPGHGDAYACLWFARFDARRPARNFGIHRRFPIAAMTATAAPFAVAIGAGNRVTSASAAGELAGAGHTAAWNLSWTPADRVYRHYPDAMYSGGGRNGTMVHSPNVLVPVSGTITVDGETIALDRDAGGQTHVWGRKHAHEWAWGRCTFRDRPGAVVEAIGAKLMRRGVTLPTLTIIGVRLDDDPGEWILMNQFRHVAFNRSSWDTGRFTFRGATARTRIAGELAARPADMLVAPYEDPDGEASYCANTEAGVGRLTIWRRRGLRWVEEQTLSGRAHFEVGRRSRDPAVTTDHVLVE